jgi:hypothetical protein
MSKSDPAVSLKLRNPKFSNDYLDFLGEYEAIYIPEGELFDFKKTEGRKYRDTVHLIALSFAWLKKGFRTNRKLRS